MLIILFFYLPRNSSSFAMSKENNRLPTVLLDILIQSQETKSLNLVTQSEAKSLEDSHVDAHEILHCTSFRSG